MPARWAAAARLGPAALLAVSLAGCGGSVDVTVPDRASACGSPAWPATVADQDRVDTSPTSPAVAAWGDPAVIARCGLADQPPTSEQCIAVDGVDWVARPLSDGTALTTFGTTPAIEVLVPARYGAAPLLLPAFSAAAKALPTNGHTCS